MFIFLGAQPVVTERNHSRYLIVLMFIGATAATISQTIIARETRQAGVIFPALLMWALVTGASFVTNGRQTKFLSASGFFGVLSRMIVSAMVPAMDRMSLLIVMLCIGLTVAVACYVTKAAPLTILGSVCLAMIAFIF